MAFKPSYRKVLRKIREKIPIEFGNYPYVTARVKAKKALLISRETYAKIFQMEIPQIARFLGEGEYSKELLSLGTKYSGVDLIEMATRDNLAKVFTQIISFSEGELKRMISEYLDRWDVWNVKTILRGKFYGASAQEITEDVIGAGSFSSEFLQSLIEKETVNEIIEALEGTIYERALSWIRAEAEEARSLAPYEDVLDQAYYGSLLEAVPPTTEPNKLFHNFVRREIDVVNVKTLLRVRGLGKELQRDLFIDGGYELTKSDLQGMVDLDLASLSHELGSLPFYPRIAAYLKEIEERGLKDVVRELEKWLLSEASRYSHIYPLSVLPVLDYIIAKTKEVENIRIIARGKADGLSNEVIKGLLVI